MPGLGEGRCHHIGSDQVVYRMSKDNPPALRVRSGDLVVVECEDAHHGLIRTAEDGPEKLDFERINPATGPIFVEGAQPGDVLAVRILDIQIAAQGCALVFEGEYGFLKCDPLGPYTKIAPVVDGQVVFRDDVRIAVRPSLGTFGVAPAGEATSTLYPGDGGANMDFKDVRAGNVVHLPVFVPGALLALGDAHAVIGDGESSGEGLEIASVVTLRVEVVSGVSLPRPMIETPTEIMTCGWGMTMEEATTCAMRDMVDFLERKLAMPRVEAYSLLGLVGDARPGNAVCAPGAMRFAVPKEIFSAGITVP